LRRLVGSGAQLRPYSQEIMDAAFKASNELYDSISSSNSEFKKVYDSYRSLRSEEYLWFQVAEFAFDNFMIRARSKT
jgi:TRAP-type mannitol/chloroaromatic compound transport system substrate-binding protein